MFAFPHIVSALKATISLIPQSHSQSTTTQSTPVLASVLETLLPGIICLPTVCISAGGLPTQNTSPSHKSYQHPIEGPTFFSNATFRRFAAFIDAILLAIQIYCKYTCKGYSCVQFLRMGLESARSVMMRVRVGGPRKRFGGRCDNAC
jgi:hypothetical protein